jgi:hypothetical protein
MKAYNKYGVEAPGALNIKTIKYRPRKNKS